MKNLLEQIALCIFGIILWINERRVFFIIGSIFLSMGIVVCHFDIGNINFQTVFTLIVIYGMLVFELLRLYAKEEE